MLNVVATNAQIPTASVFAYEDGVIAKDGKRYRYIPYDKAGDYLDRYHTQPYQGPLRILALVRIGNKYITAFEDGTIYRGSVLHGLRHTKLYYGQKVNAMIAYKGGILTAFEQGSIIWSPDTNYPGGGGTGASKTVVLQRSGQRVVAMIEHKKGVIYAFEQGGVIWSPNGSYPGGKTGFTQTLYKGPQKVTAMLPYKTKNGFLTAFSDGGVYFSLDGKKINGGGDTKRLLVEKVYAFATIKDGFVVVSFDDKARVKYIKDDKTSSSLYLLRKKQKPTPPKKKKKPINYVKNIIDFGGIKQYLKNYHKTKSITVTFQVCPFVGDDCTVVYTKRLKPNEEFFVTDDALERIKILSARY
jgi:hypothetical protein